MIFFKNAQKWLSFDPCGENAISTPVRPRNSPKQHVLFFFRARPDPARRGLRGLQGGGGGDVEVRPAAGPEPVVLAGVPQPAPASVRAIAVSHRVNTLREVFVFDCV